MVIISMKCWNARFLSFFLPSEWHCATEEAWASFPAISRKYFLVIEMFTMFASFFLVCDSGAPIFHIWTAFRVSGFKRSI